MHFRQLLLCFLIVTPCVAGPAFSQDRESVEWGPLGEIHIVDDPENVVSSELSGAWQLDAPLTQSLGGGDELVRLVFRADAEAEARLKKLLEGALAKLKKDSDQSWKLVSIGEAMRAVYLTGAIDMIDADGKTVTGDFFLISLRGNPHVILAEGNDIESFTVMLARDIEGDGDLLFLGGDFNNQSFAAFRRAAP